MLPRAARNLLLLAALPGGIAHAAEAVAPLPTVQPAFVDVPYTGPVWSLGPSVGGGMLVGMTMEVQASRTLWVQTDLGLRPGISVSDVYPNIALSTGINMGLGEKRIRHGVFAVTGLSAPLGFFDAWLAAGWSMEVFNKKGRRTMNLEVGPSLYLVREMPAETDLSWPAFLYLRAAWPFEVSRQPG
ncbi:hypothetical protein LBMAG42_25890 [Deltaproteobacteria bacterium]|nr:hypothetical protein LBMAG42_25890 [Deltaproteobacteria bacterium]